MTGESLQIITVRPGQKHRRYKLARSVGGRFNKSGVFLHLADALGAEFTLAKPFGIPELCHAVDGMMRAA